MSREEFLDAKDRTTDGGMSRAQFIQADAQYDALLLAEAVLPNGLPYPCRQPDVCASKGYCPRDPNCGE